MIYLFIGKSCAGKDTLCKKFLNTHKNAKPIISYTTRPIRENETDGVDYNFISDSEFQKLINDKKLTEYRSYNAKIKGQDVVWWYGTPKLNLSESDYIGVVEIKGAKQFINTYGTENIDITYVITEDTEREKRAKLRGSFDKTEWDRRFQTDKEDFSETNLKNLENMLAKPINLYYN